jgi:hypothetical protein
VVDITHSAHSDAEQALNSQGDREAASLGAEGDRSQAALVTQGQRRVNLLWESTQAIIALGTVLTVLVLALNNIRVPEVLQNMVFFIVGAYFSRTNHEKKGGVPDDYKGR